MIFPTYSEIKDYLNDYSMIPVCKEIYADVTTPITLLRKISQISRKFFLLESIEGGETWGRYSFLGFDPQIHLVCKDHKVRIKNGETATYEGDPYEIIRKVLKQYRSPKIDGAPPFTGGLVGSFSYSMVGYAEPVLQITKGDQEDFNLMLFDKVIAYDHLKQKMIVIVNMSAQNPKESYDMAVLEIDRIVDLIKNAQLLPDVFPEIKPDFKCSVTKQAYCDMVEKTKEYIRKGDIFQAVISRKFESEYTGSLIDAYRVLRTTNPSPYMVFMQDEDTQIICSSPETLVKLQNGRISTFPVAGSRPRGVSREEDEAFALELQNDEKELAEHNMLIDLARNDVGKIAKTGSVVLTEDKAIHRYSKIMHLTSVVEGDIKDGMDACDAIKAILPAGTLSGAPKIRACQIIEELEGQERGIYGGALGYIDFSGNMDTCIAIRMAVKRGGKVTVQAGGGIVADSIPQLEYEESENKAGAVIHAILNASEVHE